MNAAFSLRSLAVVVAGVFFCGLCGCTSTTVTTVWKSPDAGPVHFEKVLALVANASPGERRAGEEELARTIKSAPAAPAYTLVPDSDVADKDKIRADIQGHGFDGAIVIRLVATDQRTTYVPPMYHEYYDSFSFGYYENGNGNGLPSYTPGRTVTDTYITTEISLYSVNDRKLIWAGSSTTEDPSDIRDLIAQVCRATAAELRKQGLLK